MSNKIKKLFYYLRQKITGKPIWEINGQVDDNTFNEFIMSIKNYRNIYFKIVFSIKFDKEKIKMYCITEIGRNILYDIEKIFSEYSILEIFRIFDLNCDKIIYTNNKKHTIPYIFRAHHETMGL